MLSSVPCGNGRRSISAPALATATAALCLFKTAPLRAQDIDRIERLCHERGITGGLIVHVDCGRGGLTPKLRINESFIVHGVESDREDVEAARAAIHRRGLYGPVSVDHYDGLRLPYSDNMVNLIVMGTGCRVPRAEVERVLVPGGVALVEGGDPHVKPVPDDLDEWTHYLHGADGNAVSSDGRVAPPRHLRWDGGPRWSRSHEAEMSMTAMASSGGRLIYFIDDGPIGIHETPATGRPRLPDKASLVARDAYNGIILWKRPVANWGPTAFANDRIKRWGARDRMFASPTVLPRRLVVSGERIYATLGFRAPVSELDAATGRTLRTFRETRSTEEILLSDGKLFLHVRDAKGARSVVSLDLGKGKALWRSAADGISNVTLAVGGGRAFYHNGRAVVALGSSDGKELWRTATGGRKGGKGRTAGDSSLVVHDDVVVFATGGQARVLSAGDGRQLWERKGRFATFRGKPDVFVAAGLLWLGSNTSTGLDVRTGAVRKRLKTTDLFTPGHHTRCYRARATDSFLLWSKRGVEFMDLEGGNHRKHDWVRGTCRYGVLPANGLLYTSPTPCFCFPGVKKNGFNALSARDGAVEDARRVAPAVERGGAFGRAGRGEAPSPEDWPTYRHDNARSGSTGTDVPAKLREAWQVKLTGSPTPPVVAGGRLYVSEKDTHTVRCLDAEGGRPVWQFIAGGSIDSPPTIQGGRVLFGCTDGRAYCLDSTDGSLAWSFRAAPFDKRIISHGRLRSAWPVCGSVIVEKGIVYFAAGISSYLDGGIYIYGLNAATGDIVHQARIDHTGLSLRDSNDRPHDMDGAKNDILVSNGRRLFLTQNVFDMRLKRIETRRIGRYGALETDLHLVASGGFLDDSGFDRLYWMYARRWPGLYFADRA
ncbi:MAG: outer membrane protein assembly factor BamB family protein, partial [Planctomycetota bacterium]